METSEDGQIKPTDTISFSNSVCAILLVNVQGVSKSQNQTAGFKATNQRHDVRDKRAALRLALVDPILSDRLVLVSLLRSTFI